MTFLLRSALSVTVALVTGAGILAQPLPKVTLSGSVRDIYTREGYLQDATVKITSHRTRVTITLVTGPKGTFWVPALDPGTYTISVEKPGYGPLVDSKFCIVEGKPARFDAALGPDRGEPRVAAVPSPDRSIVHAPVATPSSEPMTSSEIQEAIEFGRKSTRLKAHQLTDSGGLIRRRRAVVFTPFLRVATMAQVAAVSNQQFREQEIPKAFLEKLVWIVADPAEHYLNDDTEIVTPQYLALVNDIVIRPQGKKASGDISPAWKMYLTTICDVDMLESVLGRQFSRPATVAAFPLDSIQAGSTIVFTYSTLALPLDSFGGIKVKQQVRRVVISEDDVRRWK